MWNRLREIYRIWWPIVGMGALGGYYCWLGFSALSTGAYHWRGRSIVAAANPVGFRDGVVLSLIFGLCVFAFAVLMAWFAAAGLDSKERIDAYLAKRGLKPATKRLPERSGGPRPP